MQLRDEHKINYSHQIFEGCQHRESALVCLNLTTQELSVCNFRKSLQCLLSTRHVEAHRHLLSAKLELVSDSSFL